MYDGLFVKGMNMTGWDRWRDMLTRTLAGQTEGFFIPYRYAGTVIPPVGPSYPVIEKTMAGCHPAFTEAIDRVENYRDDLMAIGPDTPPAPRWDQDWFPALDAAIAYGMIRHYQPARIVEIGSGHSTRFLARAVTDGGMATRMTAVDPAPRAEIEGLDVTFVRSTIQKAGEAPFSEIAAGDVVSMDSSHILMPGTDVDMILNRVFAALPPGVLLHIHDIFLPDGYPDDWTWRGYNEQNAVAPMITSGGYDLLWSSHYAATRMAYPIAGSVVDRLPTVPGAHPSSLWLRKR